MFLSIFFAWNHIVSHRYWSHWVFKTILTTLRAFLKSGVCTTQLCIRSDTASQVKVFWFTYSAQFSFQLPGWEIYEGKTLLLMSLCLMAMWLTKAVQETQKLEWWWQSWKNKGERLGGIRQWWRKVILWNWSLTSTMSPLWQSASSTKIASKWDGNVEKTLSNGSKILVIRFWLFLLKLQEGFILYSKTDLPLASYKIKIRPSKIGMKCKRLRRFSKHSVCTLLLFQDWT